MTVSSFKISITKKTERLAFIKMQYRGRLQERSVSIACHIADDGWVLLFNTKTELRLARILLYRLYPKVSRAHLKSNAMEELTRSLLPSDSYYIRAIGCDAIRPQRSKSAYDEEGGGSTRARLSGPETEELLDLIREHVSNIWIDNLEFEVLDRHSDESLMTAFLTREGLCRVQPQIGAFALFDEMMTGVLQFGKRRETSFSKRDRTTFGKEVTIFPVSVDYSESIQRFQIGQIRRDLTRRTVVSIIHAGNPYFLAIAQDYLDRSTFSIAILGNTVTVVPIRQNSDEAFVRLLDMLYARIGEGIESLEA
jgi:hypothetical protein